MSLTSHADISRRSILAAAAAGATVAAVKIPDSEARAQTSIRATYVLVHPAWHGGWCWKKVTPLLRARGHDVYTPTLTGLGERSHLSHPELGLETHIQDIVNVLKFEDVNRAILVGHSSSGSVITGVADQVPQQIAHLVYLDAFVPTDGQTMMDVIPPDRRQGMEQWVRAEGRGWLLPSLAPAPWDQFLREAWRITDEADRQWILPASARRPSRYSKTLCVVQIRPRSNSSARSFAVCSGRIRCSIATARQRGGPPDGAIASWQHRMNRSLRTLRSSPPCCWKRLHDLHRA